MLLIPFRLSLVCLFFCASLSVLNAQDLPSSKVDSALIERTIVEAKWKYVYTLHANSNTIIHESGDDYDFFLYFRYDYTAEEFLNGRYERKAWALSGDQIFFPFRNVKVFRVAQAGRDNLALEFTQPNSKGNYQYHFVRVSDEDAPFIKAVNRLPTVTVEGYTKRKRRKRRRRKGDDVAGIKKNKRWWSFKWLKRKKRKKNVDEQETKVAQADKNRRKTKDGIVAADLTIEMTGGGFFGGIDPVMRDHTVIKSGGRLVKEFKTVQTDLVHHAADLDIEEYNRLAKFILDKGFFTFDRVYDCSSEVCTKRKRMKPTPIPLRIMVNNGKRKKVVNIAIWGQDERGVKYVDYPDELEDVIQAVLKISNGASGSFARK